MKYISFFLELTTSTDFSVVTVSDSNLVDHFEVDLGSVLTVPRITISPGM